jgi:hypothetical protein
VTAATTPTMRRGVFGIRLRGLCFSPDAAGIANSLFLSSHRAGCAEFAVQLPRPHGQAYDGHLNSSRAPAQSAAEEVFREVRASRRVGSATFRRSALLLFLAFGISSFCILYGQDAGQLIALDPTGRFLITPSTGQPVWIQGDSPQALGVQVSTADVETYLADRQARGYNVVWIILHDEGDQAKKPNDFYNDPPFTGGVFTNFGSAYWEHMDDVIRRCAAHGMTVMANVTFVGINAGSGYSLNDVLASSDAIMTAFGAFLGKRYRNYNNIIWLLGGDADPGVSGLFGRLQDIANGIRSADTVHLITLEGCRACGGPSSAAHSSVEATRFVFGGTPPWLTLNWVYEQYANTAAGCNRAVTEGLPTLMGEDWYELEHNMTSLQLRSETYWEALSGCSLGRVMGNMAIWTMGGPKNDSRKTWQSQLDSPHSVQFALTGRLMRSRQFWKLAADTTHVYLTSGFGSGTTLSALARTSDGHTMMAYIPNGNRTIVTINMAGITDSGGKAKCWWTNPSTGANTLIGTFNNSGSRTFTAPDSNDWVLTLDSNAANLCPPGTCSARI